MTGINRAGNFVAGLILLSAAHFASAALAQEASTRPPAFVVNR
jgi:hypothetical protein